MIIYYLYKLYGNKLVFGLSFVPSENTDLETAEQFILMHTRYVCEFLVISTSPRHKKHSDIS